MCGDVVDRPRRTAGRQIPGHRIRCGTRRVPARRASANRTMALRSARRPSSLDAQRVTVAVKAWNGKVIPLPSQHEATAESRSSRRASRTSRSSRPTRTPSRELNPRRAGNSDPRTWLRAGLVAVGMRDDTHGHRAVPRKERSHVRRFGSPDERAVSANGIGENPVRCLSSFNACRSGRRTVPGGTCTVPRGGESQRIPLEDPRVGADPGADAGIPSARTRPGRRRTRDGRSPRPRQSLATHGTCCPTGTAWPALRPATSSPTILRVRLARLRRTLTSQQAKPRDPSQRPHTKPERPQLRGRRRRRQDRRQEPWASFADREP